MKTLLVLFLLIPLEAMAWTLNLSTRKGFSSGKIDVYVTSESCTNTGISSDDMVSYTQEAIEEYWNKVPTSSLELNYAGTTSTSINGDSTSAAAAKTPVNSIIIGCNNDVSSFSTIGVLAVGSLRCSGDDCQGAIILNDRSDSVLPTTSRAQIISVFAHEMGHALGLGHSSIKEALMYYSISGKIQEFLTQDDMDGITYLYPNKKKLGGLVGSCNSVALLSAGSDEDNFPKGPFLQMLMGVMLVKLLTFALAWAKAPRNKFA